MIKLKINQQVVLAREGQTLLQVAGKAGIDIPTVCHLPGLELRSVCRICSVEVKGFPHLLPACSTVVTPEMEVSTHSEKVVQARKVLMEFIIAEHGGLDTLSSEIRRYAAQLGVEGARFTLRHKPVPDTGHYGSDYIRLNLEKCILCDRCISACRDQQVIHRAHRGESCRLTFGDDDRLLGESHCTSCGDCVAVCPTGALSEYR